MRQAIEGEFILDVLQNYTSYSLAFKLARLYWRPRSGAAVRPTDTPNGDLDR